MNLLDCVRGVFVGFVDFGFVCFVADLVWFLIWVDLVACVRKLIWVYGLAGCLLCRFVVLLWVIIVAWLGLVLALLLLWCCV